MLRARFQQLRQCLWAGACGHASDTWETVIGDRKKCCEQNEPNTRGTRHQSIVVLTVAHQLDKVPIRHGVTPFHKEIHAPRICYEASPLAHLAGVGHAVEGVGRADSAHVSRHVELNCALRLQKADEQSAPGLEP